MTTIQPTAPRSTEAIRELGGTGLAREIRARAAANAAELAESGITPGLAVVVATDDESSAWYVRSIARAAGKAGIDCRTVDLGAGAEPERIRAALEKLSADKSVHGIVLQTPLPVEAHFEDLASAIDPRKDVDGANPVSLGNLAAGLPAHPPATAAAVLELLDHHEIELAGRNCVVLGRSNVVGKPVAQLLLQRDATVTVCHRHTPELTAFTPDADVLVVAVGKPGLITDEHVRDGSIVVDVGTTPTADGGLVGDVDPSVRVAGLTPVPGGVGPVTTALLLQHTVRSAIRSTRRARHAAEPQLRTGSER
ncbi:bifunctional 5,10-methylenetetrahydrofolate dehydrogenase/5,10-methenyltetrahydrofolate cyclohydrolase [Haloactinomyces albus]|uniref:Bifunctional protein FolD n=1 Tax=Haloactinomyces albus TaxID=1352928 RepID=A0AAE3ZI26_9ACTN|nr:bifunctional 5,10-methylenetetrahydrofolate dehydrogenase/5,10-methenyltetrahydrofolate cyclohydrolase [Haloactinomyces albus]MDR7304515.1 methylenetetrahydrofolate dehydrogenase (NADP+)/methenyltetrahydrofolate cyclohydrolase [Haloactinomyces albus]